MQKQNVAFASFIDRLNFTFVRILYFHVNTEYVVFASNLNRSYFVLGYTFLIARISNFHIK